MAHDLYENALSRIENYIEANKDQIIAFSDYLAAHPELSGEEYESSRLMVEKLKDKGFDVLYPYCGLPTAFCAKKSNGGNKPVVAIMVEYDALPNIGHACGHNLHGTLALFAGIALGEAIDGLCGELRIIGTPAEETDGAKIKMSEEGVFDDVDFAIMFHSYGGESYTDYRALGINGYDFTFTGRTAHSAASPWDGRSAQNAMILFMDAMNMLRLHMHDQCRLHSIILRVDGAANIIPDKAVCRVEARAPEIKMMDDLTESVFCCAKGAAIATQTEVKWERFEGRFAPMLPNLTAERMAEEVMQKHGVVCTRGHAAAGSTDVGNVSLKCPAIQPELAITSKPLSLHTREFAEATTSEEGHAALINGAKIMGDICLRVLTDEELRKKIRAEFEEASKNASA